MIDNFEFGGHVCIGFELLGLSVFDFLVSFSLLKINFIIYIGANNVCYRMLNN